MQTNCALILEIYFQVCCFTNKTKTVQVVGFNNFIILLYDTYLEMMLGKEFQESAQ